MPSRLYRAECGRRWAEPWLTSGLCVCVVQLALVSSVSRSSRWACSYLCAVWEGTPTPDKVPESFLLTGVLQLAV